MSVVYMHCACKSTPKRAQNIPQSPAILTPLYKYVLKQTILIAIQRKIGFLSVFFCKLFAKVDIK
jgi:hypothetical protein